MIFITSILKKTAPWKFKVLLKVSKSKQIIIYIKHHLIYRRFNHKLDRFVSSRLQLAAWLDVFCEWIAFFFVELFKEHPGFLSACHTFVSAKYIPAIKFFVNLVLFTTILQLCFYKEKIFFINVKTKRLNIEKLNL